MCVAPVRSACAVVLIGLFAASTAAQSAPPSRPATVATSIPTAVEVPPGYVIGPEDLLSVVFWQEKELSTDVVVRPDGKISLPLLNDVQAAGNTPEQLASTVSKAASKFIAEPLATVIVKQINSRKVFVLGAVGKQGPVSLTSDMTVLQLIAQVGGLQEYADRKGIVIVRRENGHERRYKFNYDDVMAGRKPEQNIKLEPGDTLLVFD